MYLANDVQKLFILPHPWILWLPSNHPCLCYSHFYFLPPGVLSGQFLTAMVSICRDVPGKTTSSSTAMLRDNDINIWAMDCRTRAVCLSAMHSHCSHTDGLLQGTPGTVFSIGRPAQVALSTTSPICYTQTVKYRC